MRSDYQRDLLVSVHVPKAGGSTWQRVLENLSGDAFIRDYGDCPNYRDLRSYGARRVQRLPEDAERCARIAELLEQPGPIVSVHGHFMASKYSHVFPDAITAIWFRHPATRLASRYHHDVRHPRRIARRKGGPPEHGSLLELVKDPRHANIFAKYLAGQDVRRFTFVGILEEYDRSLDLFERIIGTSVTRPEAFHQNPDRSSSGTDYELGDEVLQAVETVHATDLALYDEAVAHFQSSCQEHGIL